MRVSAATPLWPLLTLLPPLLMAAPPPLTQPGAGTTDGQRAEEPAVAADDSFPWNTPFTAPDYDVMTDEYSATTADGDLTDEPTLSDVDFRPEGGHESTLANMSDQKESTVKGDEMTTEVEATTISTTVTGGTEIHVALNRNHHEDRSIDFSNRTNFKNLGGIEAVKDAMTTKEYEDITGTFTTDGGLTPEDMIYGRWLSMEFQNSKKAVDNLDASHHSLSVEVLTTTTGIASDKGIEMAPQGSRMEAGSTDTEIKLLNGVLEPDLHHEFDPVNPYNHWDSDSEEQEFEVEMEHHPREEEEYEEEVEAEATGEPEVTTQRSYILQLAGNSTIVRLRQRDFAKYLKLNLAARLSLEYDNVKVNSVVLEPPRLLVNVSVVTAEERPEDQQEAPLLLLAETNATLLELSGEEYHVVRMLPLRARRPGEYEEDAGGAEDADEVEGGRRGEDAELVLYCVLGGACAVLAAVALMLAAARYLRGLAACLLGRGGGEDAGGGNDALLHSFLAAPCSVRVRHHRMADAAAPSTPPSVIYSGAFAAAAATPHLALPATPPRTSPASTKLRLFGCKSSSLLLPLPSPRRFAASRDHQPLGTPPACHENPNFRD